MIRTHRRLTAAALALALVVVSLGAWVRLSDAGLGCPDWPGKAAWAAAISWAWSGTPTRWP